MKVIAGEALHMLQGEYRGLVKYNREGLAKAYKFGQLVRALNDAGFSYQVMADELSVSDQTVSKYARLARRYATEKELRDMSEALDTVDVQVLAWHGSKGGQFHTELHCTRCGNGQFTRTRVPGPKPELATA